MLVATSGGFLKQDRILNFGRGRLLARHVGDRFVVEHVRQGFHWQNFAGCFWLFVDFGPRVAAFVIVGRRVVWILTFRRENRRRRYARCERGCRRGRRVMAYGANSIRLVVEVNEERFQIQWGSKHWAFKIRNPFKSGLFWSFLITGPNHSKFWPF